MDYQALIDRLSRRGLFRIYPGLDRVRGVLTALGNPQEGVPVIHIAGTNGKGSVAACLESVLRHAGYRTGLYLSPHLQDVRERIQINNQPIPITRFWQLARSVLQTEQKIGYRLTYFEFLTVMAFVAFTADTVDVVILETGMGGRWDATNVVTHPLLTIITSIGLDHTQWLGRTVQAIAREKAGILKTGCPVLIGSRGRPAQVISSLARKAKAPALFIDRDFKALPRSVNWEEGFQRIEFRGVKGVRHEVTVRLLGTFQVDNTALVLAGLDILLQKGWTIPETAVTEGLSKVKWPGRFHRVTYPKGPSILLDGAHNPDALKRFLESIHKSPWKKTSKTIVFSAYQDKDYHHMLSLLAVEADHLILCTLPGSRSLSARKVKASLADCETRVDIVADPHKAFQRAVQITARQNLIIVTGSLALVGMLLGDTIAEKRSVDNAAALDAKLLSLAPSNSHV